MSLGECIAVKNCYTKTLLNDILGEIFLRVFSITSEKLPSMADSPFCIICDMRIRQNVIIKYSDIIALGLYLILKKPLDFLFEFYKTKQSYTEKLNFTH